MGMGDITFLAYSWPSQILLSLKTKLESHVPLNECSRKIINSMELQCFHLYVNPAMYHMKKALAITTHLEGVCALTPAGVEYCSDATEAEIKLLLLQTMPVEV